MTDVNSILERLQKGESAEDIANEYAKAVNEALKLQKAKEEEARKAEEAKKLADQKAKEKEAQLDKYMNDCVLAIKSYLELAYPEICDSEDVLNVEDTVAQLRASVDAVAQIGLAAIKAQAVLDKNVSAKKINKADPDAVLNEFLKGFGW